MTVGFSEAKAMGAPVPESQKPWPYDHRMAMAFGSLGLVRSGIWVRDPGCVAKSHPGFWDDVDVLRSQA